MRFVLIIYIVYSDLLRCQIQHPTGHVFYTAYYREVLTVNILPIFFVLIKEAYNGSKLQPYKHI